MAEGFARALGSDVLIAQSAGLAPALAVAPLTNYVMREKNIDLGDYYPKALRDVGGGFDLTINMSGYSLPTQPSAQVEVWDVCDPIGESEEMFRHVRDEIEQHVRKLIERLRSRKPASSEAVSAGPPVDTRRRPTRQ
jgi:protein-tyrosine-phosphatase